MVLTQTLWGEGKEKNEVKEGKKGQLAVLELRGWGQI